MKHIGLFEGIGGFSYAAHLMGWPHVVFQIFKAIQQFEDGTNSKRDSEV